MSGEDDQDLKGKSFDGGPVGYKRPPVEHQFKKGQKPARSGRRKGSKNFATIIAEELNSRVSVVENGKKTRITKREAMTKRLVAKSLTGSTSDLVKALNTIERFAPGEFAPENNVLIIRTIPGDEDE